MENQEKKPSQLEAVTIRNQTSKCNGVNGLGADDQWLPPQIPFSIKIGQQNLYHKNI